jgi:hypothetical protein
MSTVRFCISPHFFVIFPAVLDIGDGSVAVTRSSLSFLFAEVLELPHRSRQVRTRLLQRAEVSIFFTIIYLSYSIHRYRPLLEYQRPAPLCPLRSDINDSGNSYIACRYIVFELTASPGTPLPE